MLTNQILIEVLAAGTDPTEAAFSLLCNPEIDVVSFGERHLAWNPTRLLMLSLAKKIPQLPDKTRIAFALELPQSAQPALDRFSRNEPMDLYEELKGFGASLSVERSSKKCGSEGDALYFAAITIARDYGAGLLAIDKDRGRDNELWESEEFAKSARDEEMCAALRRRMTEGGCSKAVLLAGSNHLYTRPVGARGNFRTLAEALRDHGRVYSIASIFLSEPENRGNEPSFDSLRDIVDMLENPLFVPMKDCPQTADVQIGSDRRCPWGSCHADSNPRDSCPGLSCGICPADEPVPICCGYWDALIFWPTGAARKQKRRNPNIWPQVKF